MRVSKSSDHWCALGTMSNFEKRNLRSGHLMRPGHVTFWVSGSSFFVNLSNCWMNSYGKFGGATRRRFLAICEKPYGGGGLKSTPPPVRGLTAVDTTATNKPAKSRCENTLHKKLTLILLIVPSISDGIFNVFVFVFNHLVC